MHKTYILGLPSLEVRRQIPKITTDDHYYQSAAAMTRCKLVALKFFPRFNTLHWLQRDWWDELPTLAIWNSAHTKLNVS